MTIGAIREKLGPFVASVIPDHIESIFNFEALVKAKGVKAALKRAADAKWYVLFWRFCIFTCFVFCFSFFFLQCKNSTFFVFAFCFVFVFLQYKRNTQHTQHTQHKTSVQEEEEKAIEEEGVSGENRGPVAIARAPMVGEGLLDEGLLAGDVSGDDAGDEDGIVNGNGNGNGNGDGDGDGNNNNNNNNNIDIILPVEEEKKDNANENVNNNLQVPRRVKHRRIAVGQWYAETDRRRARFRQKGNDIIDWVFFFYIFFCFSFFFAFSFLFCIFFYFFIFFLFFYFFHLLTCQQYYKIALFADSVSKNTNKIKFKMKK